MLSTAGDIEVVGTAGDGEEGLRKVRELAPDVVTLDVKMPRLGGLETLERLMREQPVPVLLMSTLTQEGAEVTLRGLELGAMDFVDKSSVQPMTMLSLADELVAKIRRPRGRARARAPARSPALGGGRRGGPGRGGRHRRLHRRADGAADRRLGAARGAAGGGADRAAHPARVHEVARREARRAQRDPGARGARRRRRRARLVLIAPAGIHSRLVRRGGSVVVSLDEEPRDALHRPVRRRAHGLGGRGLRPASRRRRAHRHGLGRDRGPARDPRAPAGGRSPRARRRA